MKHIIALLFAATALVGCTEESLDRTVRIGNEVFRESECVAKKINAEEALYTVECPSVNVSVAIEPTEGKLARVEFSRPEGEEVQIISTQQIVELLDVMFNEKPEGE